MAIFGTFDEIAPPDALNAAARYTGVFIARLPPSCQIEIFLRSGSITGLRENGLLLDDLMGLHERFARLLRAQAGQFEFRRLPNLRVEGPFSLPLEQAIASGLACMEELASSADHLPSAETVFEWVEHQHVWLGDELELFWERTEVALRHGTHSQRAAELAKTSVARAQWYLHRLRLAGLIRPRRAGGLLDRTSERPAPKSQPLPDHTENPTAPQENRRVTLAEVNVAVPPKPMLRRLLDSLSSLLR